MTTVAAWMERAFSQFNDAREQFEEMTSNVFSYKLLPDQQAAVDSKMSQAESLEKSDDPDQALRLYITILRDLPPNAPISVQDRVRERIAEVAAHLNPPPPVPGDAARHLAYAIAAIQDGKASGDPAKLDYAVDQLDQVLKIAPWRPEPYYNLGVALGEQKHYEEAVRYMKLYLQAAPNAPDAAAVQQMIYQFEYKAGAR